MAVKRYNGTAWVTEAGGQINSSLLQTKAATGLNLVIPTSATGGTVGSNGAVTIGSAVSSVVVNGAFSSTYDNYKVIISGGAAAGDTYLNFSLTGATSVYSYAFTYTAFGTSSALGDQAVNAASMAYGGYGGTSGLDMNIEINSPFLSKWTTFKTPIVTSGLSGIGNGVHKSATSFTGFTITAQSNAITGGTIRIYGYNNG